MISAPATQDILKYKAKFVGNFTTRNLIFGALGVAAIYLTNRYVFHVEFGMSDLTGGQINSTEILLAVLPGFPFFLFGWWYPFGQPLEKILIPTIIDNFIAPAIRKNEIHYSTEKPIPKKQQAATKSKSYKEIK